MTDIATWGRRLSGIMNDHESQLKFAALLAVDVRTIRRWCRGQSPPRLENLAAIALATPYTLVEQLTDLGYIARAQMPWVASVPAASPRLLLDRLWRAVDEVTLGRPSHHDLARAVMAGHEGEPAAHRYGRWRPRLFDVPTGDVYPHVAYRGVEFQLGLDEEGRLIPAWRQKEWDNLGIGVPMEFAAPWIRSILIDNERVEDHFRSAPISYVAAWERLELRWRLHELSRQVQIHWYGEVGRLHRRLIANTMTTHERHIAVVRAYQEHLPDPTAAVPAPFLEDCGAARVLLVGSPATLTTYLSAVVGEALGWRSYRVADLVQQYTARPPVIQTGDAAGKADYSFVHQAIADGHVPRHCVIAVSEFDTLVDEAGELTKPARRMLSADGTYVVLLESDSRTDALWEYRQRDQLPVGVDLRPTNKVETLEKVRPQLVRALEDADPMRGRWVHLYANFVVPWWNPNLPLEAIPPFLEPRIGDQIVRAAYALLVRLSTGKLPIQSRPRAPRIAEGSLLRRYVKPLAQDRRALQAWRDDFRRPSKRTTVS